MALIITDKNKIIAIADAVRAQTGSTEPLTLDQLIAAVGEIPSTPDTPDTPEEPVVVSLAPGLYNSEYDPATGTYITAYDKYVAGDIEGANSMLDRTWDDIITSGDIIIDNYKIVEASSFGGADKFLVIDNRIKSLGGTEDRPIGDDPMDWGPLWHITAYGIYIPNSITSISRTQLTDQEYLHTIIIEEGETPVTFYGGPFERVSRFILPKNIKLERGFQYVRGAFIEWLHDYGYTFIFNGTMNEWNTVLSNCYFYWCDELDYDECDHIMTITCTDGVVTETPGDMDWS